MLFTITGKHIEITEGLRAHAQEKVEKLPRFHNNITHTEVVIEGKEEGGSFSVEVIAHIEHEELATGKDAGPDMYACIDSAMRKIERQLKKRKEKQRDNRHSGNADKHLQNHLGEKKII